MSTLTELGERKEIIMVEEEYQGLTLEKLERLITLLEKLGEARAGEPVDPAIANMSKAEKFERLVELLEKLQAKTSSEHPIR